MSNSLPLKNSLLPCLMNKVIVDLLNEIVNVKVLCEL